MAIKISKQEQDWQAQDDARTLERYQEIINDKSRLNKAIKVANQTAQNLKDRASALNKTLSGLKKKR